MDQQNRMLKYLTVIGFGLTGQMGCWGIMIGGQALTTMENTLIMNMFKCTSLKEYHLCHNDVCTEFDNS